MDMQEQNIFKLLIFKLSIYVGAVKAIRDAKKTLFLEEQINGILEAMLVLGYIDIFERNRIKESISDFKNQTIFSLSI